MGPIDLSYIVLVKSLFGGNGRRVDLSVPAYKATCSLLFQNGRFVWVNGKSTSLPFPPNGL